MGKLDDEEKYKPEETEIRKKCDGKSKRNNY